MINSKDILKIIDQELVRYCQNHIIPQYLHLDLAHQPNHVVDVIHKSLKIAQDYDVDLNCVYVVAVFHDLGLLIDRKNHHIEGGKLLLKDRFINQMFTPDAIQLMKEAIEDHRASNQRKPRNIYGKIISEADRLIEPKQVILRCLQFQLSKSMDQTFESIYPPVKAHLIEKYGSDGYIKFWLKTKDNQAHINTLRSLIKDEEKLKKTTKKLYNQLKLSIE